MEGRGRRLRPAVEAVRKRIVRWRAMRPKSNSMPEDLWAAAVSLTEEHGVWRVARELGLSYTTLKERVGMGKLGPAEGTTRAVDDSVSDGKAECGTAFVEWDASRLFAGPQPGASVALAAADGATMTIQLPSGQPIDLAVLADSFWRRGA